MTSKNHKWQTAWSRLPNGDLQHASGLIINIERGAGYIDLQVQQLSLVIFQASEGARGVPLHDQVSRLQRLVKEAQQWHQSNR